MFGVLTREVGGHVIGCGPRWSREGLDPCARASSACLCRWTGTSPSERHHPDTPPEDDERLCAGWSYTCADRRRTEMGRVVAEASWSLDGTSPSGTTRSARSSTGCKTE